MGYFIVLGPDGTQVTNGVNDSIGFYRDGVFLRASAPQLIPDGAHGGTYLHGFGLPSAFEDGDRSSRCPPGATSSEVEVQFYDSVKQRLYSVAPLVNNPPFQSTPSVLEPLVLTLAEELWGAPAPPPPHPPPPAPPPGPVRMVLAWPRPPRREENPDAMLR